MYTKIFSIIIHIHLRTLGTVIVIPRVYKTFVLNWLMQNIEELDGYKFNNRNAAAILT